MLYYVAWLVVILVAGLVTLWLCKEGAEACRRVFGSKSGNEKVALTDEIRDIPGSLGGNGEAAPWGRGGHQSPGTQARTHASVPRQSTLWGGSQLDEGERDLSRSLKAPRKGPEAESEFWSHYAGSSRPEGHGTGSSRD
ncbi:MAG: hypothetical protein PVF46_03405 [Lysobacterales bacterium]|jgi:hypothetical protein